MFASLDGLAELGFRSGINVRPTLLRVLTDLYVQKAVHTPDEDRHYTELTLRLVEAVDVPARAAVAERLANHPSPPAAVVARLVRDLPEVAAPLWRKLSQPLNKRVEGRSTPAAITIKTPSPAGDDVATDVRQSAEAIAAADPAAVGGARELNELFLGANAEERRLILLNLEVLTPLPAERTSISRDPHACQRLEAAALAHDIEQFVQHLARTLHIARAQALRIARDELGEPVVVAAKALKMPPDMLQRVLLFLNPSVGQSVARVHALADLYHEITLPAAEHLLAIWQAVERPERPTRSHWPRPWNDDATRNVRGTSAGQRGAPHGQTPAERRNAS